ncbi:3-phosphoshikimate 1-carboxyvinyltransferase [Holzapfeliella floricola]|uniref:3-phosphoshikimate 1-carboxyvinyltransferase n=1 Tax=Holzapfeliella floricola DSM 23037 = JCM 16512 TaxID=1423744 RepID=A0A0R2DWV6_9LACO|nr:3-phosphoshikimate 1-carboxyvinyltransferase [Holzapfeliella floricola]KRN04797.1 3-phosphoshikimate 1-carboxyvinyltransferase [Holzapfeliella floricola DSM 23037 = JCM 16512]
MKELTTALKTGLTGELTVPGDKSISHRAIMLGALAEGTTTIHNFLQSKDCLSTLKAFQDLGVEIDNQIDVVTVRGVGLNGLKQPQKPLDMGNSGTTTRLIMGILAAQRFQTDLFGDDSLSKRPLDRVCQPLRQMGAKIESKTDKLPLTIEPSQIKPITYDLPVASAQVKSAVILAGLFAQGKTQIIEKQPTRDHTKRLLNTFAPDTIQTQADKITVNPPKQLVGQTVEIPSDISSAAFFMVAAATLPNSDLTLKAISLNKTRTGLLKVLEKMGVQLTFKNQRNLSGEPVADVQVKTSQLNAIELKESDIPAMIDELPIIALLCSFANGTSKITGAQELRVKETDRIAAVVTEFKKLGIAITELPDGFIIEGKPELTIVNPQLSSHKDHRIGMTLAIAALKANQSLELADAEYVGISYPSFFEDLEKVMR